MGRAGVELAVKWVSIFKVFALAEPNKATETIATAAIVFVINLNIIFLSFKFLIMELNHKRFLISNKTAKICIEIIYIN